MPFWRWPRHLWLWRCIIMVAAASSMRHISIVCHLTTNTCECESLILLYFTHKSNNYIKLWNKTNTILSIYKCCPTMQLQEGQHLLTGQFQFTISIANFRLLANQWAERRLVTQLRHGCLAMRRRVCAMQFQCGSVPLHRDIKGTELPLPIYWYHSKDNWLRYNYAAESFYIMNFAADFSSFIVETVQKTTNLGTLSPFWGS